MKRKPKKKDYIIGEWQLCPKCYGQKMVSMPPNLNGDVTQWAASATSYVCGICRGEGKIQKPIINL